MNYSMLTYVGGKAWLIPHIDDIFPKSISGNVSVPFCGGCSLPFWMMDTERISSKSRVFLSDTDEDVIRFLKVLSNKEQRENLIHILMSFKKNHSEDFYYGQRAKFISLESDVEKAAIYYYVNKCGFNGMWRKNNSGGCNVPWNQKPVFPLDIDSIVSSGNLLQRSQIEVLDFETALIQQRDESEFVYLDPPFQPDHEGAYNEYQGGSADGENTLHRSVLFHFMVLDSQGVKIALSGADTDSYRLWFRDYNIHEFSKSRSFSSDPATRRKTTELLITNF